MFQCLWPNCDKTQKFANWDYCEVHQQMWLDKQKPDTGVGFEKQQQGGTVVTVNDHIKISIEQTAKGARCTVTYDRSDHDMDKAIIDSVLTYKRTIQALKDHDLKVDEA